MGEDTTQAQALCAEHPGCSGHHGTQRSSSPEPQGRALLLGEQDVEDALSLLDDVEAGRAAGTAAWAPDAGLLDAAALEAAALEAAPTWGSLLLESTVPAPGAEHLPLPDLAQTGARLRESAQALLPDFAALDAGDAVETAYEVDAALDALEAPRAPHGASRAEPAWASQRAERLHAGAIERRTEHEAPLADAVAEELGSLDTWYVAPAGVPQGPLTLDVLRQRWEAGEVGPDTPCWSGGMARWVPLARVLKLAGALAPPVPRLSLEQVASSLRAPPAPPAAKFQPGASGALRSLLDEELAQERSEARARAEALARMQEARAAALATYVPLPAAALPPEPASVRRAGSRIAFALLGGALGALALCCAMLAFALMRSRELAAPAPVAVQAPVVQGAAVPPAVAGVAAASTATAGSAAATQGAAATDPASAAQGAATGAVAARAAAAKDAAVAKDAAAKGAAASPAVSSPAVSSTATSSTAAPAAAKAVAAKASVTEASASAFGAKAAGAKALAAADGSAQGATPGEVKRAVASTGSGTRAVAAKAEGEVEFGADEEEEQEEEASAKAPPAALGPDEEFERELGAEEPPLAAEDADAAPAAAPAAAAPAAPTTYVPPAPGGGADVRETLAQADVLETVLAHRAEVKACADAQRRLQPDLSGKLVVRFSVLPSGTTADVATETEALQGSALATCIERAVRSWSFPVHRVQGAQIRFPFTL